MKKSVIKLCGIVLAAVCATCGEMSSLIRNENVVYGDDIFQIQQEASEAHEVLYESFDWNETYIFPEDFAGDYILYDTLHVLVTNRGAISRYAKLLERYDDKVEFDVVEYSYNELWNATEKFVKSIGSEEDVFSYCVDVKENKGKVVLTLESFLESCDGRLLGENGDLPIAVEFHDCKFEQESTLVAGSWFSTSLGGATIGGSGTYNGLDAFVTSGHGQALNKTCISGGDIIGSIQYLQCASGGYGDFAFITMTNGYTSTNAIFTTGGAYTYLTGYKLDPAVGTYLYKFGNVSGQAYCCVTDANLTMGGIHGLSMASRISGTSTSGDSGGPYRQGTLFCGVHRGSSTVDSNTYYVFTPYKYIKNAGFTIGDGI